MHDAVHPERIVRFGTFELDLEGEELRRNGLKLKLTGQPFQVLAILLEHPGRIVTREELRNRLWADTFVDFDHNLNAAINKVREVLGDSAENPRFVETVPRRGYRFIAASSSSPSNGMAVPGVPLETPMGHVPDVDSLPALTKTAVKIRWGATAAATLLVLAAGSYWYLSRPLRPPHITRFTQITHDGRQKSLAGTDGSRLYFTDWTRDWIAQVGINGGEIARVPVTLPGAKMALMDISSDGANALIYTIEEGHYPNAQWVVPLLGGAAKRLQDGAEGAFSPDGNSVIYCTLNGDIFITRIDGTETRKLASIGPLLFSVFPNPATFQWSPDRKVIWFDHKDGLWEMLPDGSGIHPLFPDWKSHIPDSGRWTQDGSFFVFDADGQIWVLDQRSGPFRRPLPAPIQLTSGPLQWGPPVLGRDGKTIFAVGSSPKGELMRIDPKTGASRPFLGGISAEFVAFSPDGNYVAYITYPENTLWRANRDGSSPLQLTPSEPQAIFEPRWSPDSKEILFGAFGSPRNRYSMHRISSSDGRALWLMSEETEDYDDPNWSPDGNRVVFAHGHKNQPDKMDIRIVDLNTRKVTVLPGSQGKWAPRWSPDGRYISTLANPQVNHIPVFDLNTQRWFDIPVNGEVQYESFSHDGRFIYFMRYGTDKGVFRVPVTGGKEQRVVDLTGWRLTSIWSYSMRLDPTDAPLVLRDASSSDIYALSLE